jgi:hypothetical protein
MRIAFTVAYIAAFSVMSAPTFSAENFIQIIEATGKVLVTTPEGAFPAKVGQTISDGDSIFVGDGSVARVATADGTCPLNLPPRRVTVINSATLCATSQITPTAGEPSAAGIPPAAVGVGFFAAAAATAAIITISEDDDNDTPISAP